MPEIFVQRESLIETEKAVRYCAYLVFDGHVIDGTWVGFFDSEDEARTACKQKSMAFFHGNNAHSAG